MGRNNKTCIGKHVTFACLMMIAICTVCSCEKVDLTESTGSGTGTESNSGSSSGKHKVTIVARSSSTQDITYPIEVYAYNSLGEETAHQTVTSASQGISMSLQEGQYTIAAMSGASAFDFTKGYSTSPLMTGSTTVNVGSSALTANIVLSYAVAALDITMSDVPAEVTAASVTIASQYTKVTDQREYSGAGSVTIPCSKSSGSNKWQTGTVYVMPGCKESTEMTIALTTASGTVSYGITYPSGLKAATPYHFSGSYSGESGGVKLTGTLSQEDWLDTVEGSFSFGPSGSNSFSDKLNAEVIKVSSIPAQGTVYDGHLVALVANSGNSDKTADALLISVKEWASMTSALYETDPTLAERLAGSYTEGSLSGWSIPTNDQVKELRSVWTSDNIDVLNTALSSVAGSDALVVTGDDGKNARYLCEAATCTYTWAKGGSIVAAGKTVKTYRLRVVKKVKFSM